MIPLFYVTMSFFVFVCVILVLLILIQKGRGGGLASAFGGAGGQTAFGSKTGDVLTWATSVCFGLFILFAVLMNVFANQIGHAPTPTALGSNSFPVSQVPGSTGMPSPSNPSPSAPQPNPIPIGQ